MTGNARRLLDALDHPLLGVDPRYTAVALGYVGLLVAGIALDDLLARGLVDATPRVLDSPIEGFIAALILALVLSNLVAPVVYGLVNGGPAGAGAIALVPQLAVAAVSWRWLLTSDALVALLGAALGASVAVAHLLYRERGRPAPPPGLFDGLLVATGLTVVAVVAAARFAASAPPVLGPTTGWLWAATALVVVCGACWLTAVRCWERDLVAS